MNNYIIVKRRNMYHDIAVEMSLGNTWTIVHYFNSICVSPEYIQYLIVGERE